MIKSNNLMNSALAMQQALRSNAFEGVMGTSFPVFISRGNHDESSWSGYWTKAANPLGGATFRIWAPRTASNAWIFLERSACRGS